MYLACMVAYFCFSYAASGKSRGVTIGKSSILDFAALFNSLHEARYYALHSHPLKALLILQYQGILTTHKLIYSLSQLISPIIVLDLTVSMGCYGLSCNKISITCNLAINHILLSCNSFVCMTREVQGVLTI